MWMACWRARIAVADRGTIISSVGFIRGRTVSAPRCGFVISKCGSDRLSRRRKGNHESRYLSGTNGGPAGRGDEWVGCWHHEWRAGQAGETEPEELLVAGSEEWGLSHGWAD